MNKLKLTIVMAVSILIWSCVIADSPIFTRRGLEGTWYSGGARDKICSIEATRDGLIARNENGQTSKLVYDRGGYVVALDWEGGLRGNIRGDRIEWANNSYWVRGFSR